MRTTTLIAMSVLTAGCSTTTTTTPNAVFIDRGVFNDMPFVMGEGSTQESASKNAAKAIPPTYEVEEHATRVASCADVGEYSVWDRNKQDYVCASHRYRAMISLAPKDPIERKRMEKSRAAMLGTKRYVGTGADSNEALKDLLARLPKDAVIDGYSIGCTKDINVDPETGHTSCADKPRGNRREATAYVIEPNAAKIISPLDESDGRPASIQ